MTIPKLSSPLAKGIRTTEGILTTIITTLIALTSVVDPHALPKKEGAILVAATTVLYTLQRGLIKIVAIQKGLGVAAPIDDEKLDHTLAAIVDQATAVDNLFSQHQQIADDLEHLKNIDLTKLPSKEEIEQLFSEVGEHLTQLAEQARQPVQPVQTAALGRERDPMADDVADLVSTPPQDPLGVAADAVTPEDEAQTQPPPDVDIPDSARTPDGPGANAGTHPIDPQQPV